MSRRQNEKPMTREPIGKKLRFEVFKRDSFTCQYCGAKAPEAVLHCDHIHPVAEGGKTELLNLVTACEDCNLGKGARLLDDNSVVTRQQAQIEDLQARREQLEMMLEWRDGLQKQSTDMLDEICSRISQKSYFEPNAHGRDQLRKWIKRYGLEHVLNAIDTAFDSYLVWGKERPSNTSWNTAWRKVAAIASLNKQAEEKPYMPKLAYINGILRNRFGTPHDTYMADLEFIVVTYGVSTDILERAAKTAFDWDSFIKTGADILIAERSKDGQN